MEIQAAVFGLLCSQKVLARFLHRRARFMASNCETPEFTTKGLMNLLKGRWHTMSAWSCLLEMVDRQKVVHFLVGSPGLYVLVLEFLQEVVNFMVWDRRSTSPTWPKSTFTPRSLILVFVFKIINQCYHSIIKNSNICVINIYRT